MSSHYSRLIIESYKDSFGVFIGDEEHVEVTSEEEVKAFLSDWLNNEINQMNWRKKNE